MAVLRVSDAGRGIAPDDLPYVFERFYRADRSRGRTPGSGIGLTVARELIVANGGTIDVEATGRPAPRSASPCRPRPDRGDLPGVAPSAMMATCRSRFDEHASVDEFLAAAGPFLGRARGRAQPAVRHRELRANEPGSLHRWPGRASPR